MARAKTVLPRSSKALSVSPLKLSPALGASMALLGVEETMPCLHGAQGCTAFALVLMVRHFREPIALQTTALNEVTTILGGGEIIEQALVTIQSRNKPRLIGLLSTALTETRGEDLRAEVNRVKRERPELADTEVVVVSAPDFAGSLEAGWSRAVRALIDRLVPEDAAQQPRIPNSLAVLAGAHLTPADLDALRDLIESFGLEPTFVPDLSRSLDGHMPDPSRWVSTSQGGVSVAAIRALGQASAAVAIGAHMAPSARLLADRSGLEIPVLDSATGLAATDRLVSWLAQVSGRPVPARLRRQRSQLVDALMDAHFAYSGARIALAGEPGLVAALGPLVTGLGARLACVVLPTDAPELASLPADQILIGDLDDLRAGAAGCDLMIASTNGRLPAAAAGVPLFRAGFPVYDRLGAGQQVSVGYHGTREMVFAIGNALMAATEAHHADHTNQAHHADHTKQAHHADHTNQAHHADPAETGAAPGTPDHASLPH